MMRLFQLLLVWLVAVGASAQTGQPVSSTISSVTVYLEGAQVTRTASRSLPAGRTELIFSGLTAELDPASVQLKAAGAITVLSVSHRLDYYEPPAVSAAVAELRDSLERLNARQSRWQARAEIAREELDLLAANRQFAGQQTGLQAEDLERGVTFYRERLTALKMEQLTIADSLASIARQRTRLSGQLAEREGRLQRATSQVLATVSAEAATAATFELSYLVRAAGWVPNYDIRVEDIARPIDLRYRAKVRQNSGEDWTGVQLTLSSGDPSRSANAPELQPWRLQPNQRPWWEAPGVNGTARALGTVTGRITDEYGEPLIGANILVKGASTGTVTDYDGVYSLPVPAGARELVVSYIGFDTQEIPIRGNRMDVRLAEGMQLDEVVVTGAARGVRIQKQDRASESEPARPDREVPVQTERRPTTVNFVIELPYTIPADGKPRDVEIRQHLVPADYRYFAVPKLKEEAFLRAAVAEWEQYDLLSGDMQLFFEGTFLGRSYLDVSALTDTLQLSLGRDEQIVIERRADENYRSSGFLSNRQRDSRGWILEVRNKKNEPVQLTLVDQVPISGNGEIDVRYELPEGVRHNEKTGRLTWNLNLAPRAVEQLQFGYEVRYPNGMRVYLE